MKKEIFKKSGALLIVFSMLFGMIPGMGLYAAASTPALADTWDGTVDPITKGDGSEAAPYLIESAEQLAYLAQEVNEGNASKYEYKHILLTTDIDLAGNEWTPIAKTNTFRGIFDGGEHVIYNMAIGSASKSADTIYRAGLFGYIDEATIKNLGVENIGIYVDGNDGNLYAGGLVGVVDCDSSLPAQIINCYSTGTIVNKSNSTYSVSGGLVGKFVGMNNEINPKISELGIYNSYSTANVTGKYAGGLIGMARKGYAIKNCYAAGTASVTDDLSAKSGGFIAWIETNYGGDSTFVDCYWNSDKNAKSVGLDETAEPVSIENKKTSAEMQTKSFVSLLNARIPAQGESWYLVAGENDGYPMLKGIGNVPAKYTVSFESNGGSTVAAQNDVEEDSNISAPTAPIKADHTFLGWFKDTGLSEKFIFAIDTVNANMTLYAKWMVGKPTGATYLTTEDNLAEDCKTETPDGDLDVKVKSSSGKNIEFNIVKTGVEPIASAELLIKAYDVDEEDGEIDEVYFNGIKIGALSGAGSAWSTTKLTVPIEAVKPGKNTVKITISKGWSVTADWGQLITNGGSTNLGKIESATGRYDSTLLSLGTEFTILGAEQEGNYILELNLIDDKGNNAGVTKHEFPAKAKEAVNINTLKFEQLGQGNYTIQAYLFDKASGMMASSKTLDPVAVPLSTDATVKSISAPVKVDHAKNTIEVLVGEMPDKLYVWTLEEALTKNAGANWKVVDAGINITNKDGFDLAIPKNWDNLVVSGDQLAVLAEDGKTVNVYTITVKEDPNVRHVRTNDGNVFLGGKFIELGISNYGYFGTSIAAPTIAPAAAGFHVSGYSNKLGMRVDGDGFDEGKAPTTGDFFLPGSPIEGFVLGYKLTADGDPIRLKNYNADTPVTEIDTLTEDASYGSTLKAIITGLTPDAKLEITQEIYFGVNDKVFKTKISVTNRTQETLYDVRYTRSVDPDQDADIKSDFQTKNSVISNPTKDGSAIVVAKGAKTDEPFIFMSTDQSARAAIASADLLDPYSTELWQEDGSKLLKTEETKDTGIHMTFKIGDLAADETKTVEMQSSLNPKIDEVIKVPDVPSSGGGGSSVPASDGVDILVNGKIEKAATGTTTKQGDQTVTKIVVDDKKVEEKLKSEGNKAVVTILVKSGSDVVVGTLTGQTVKSMESKEAVLEVKTDKATYVLPASQINIDAISKEIGKHVELKDIAVSVKIAEPSKDTGKIIENTAKQNSYQVISKPVEFEITCTNGSKTIAVSRFNAYVERLVPIPEGVNPSKITTGIVLNADGTFSHVPTAITIIDKKYYAKINSLTNSTYSVIWSPKTFKDVEHHWAKDAVNNMGSRLVIKGVGEDTFEPNRGITRAEFAVTVVRALGLMRPGSGTDAYKDVASDAWYYDGIAIAEQYGLISGYGNGHFGPQDKITREQAMTIIERAMKITKLTVNLDSAEVDKLMAPFNDSKNAAGWAKESIAACMKAELVSGRSGNLIAAKENITRAEVSVLVERLLQTSKLI